MKGTVIYTPPFKKNPIGPGHFHPEYCNICVLINASSIINLTIYYITVNNFFSKTPVNSICVVEEGSTVVTTILKMSSKEDYTKCGVFLDMAALRLAVKSVSRVSLVHTLMTEYSLQIEHISFPRAKWVFPCRFLDQIYANCGKNQYLSKAPFQNFFLKVIFFFGLKKKKT